MSLISDNSACLPNLKIIILEDIQELWLWQRIRFIEI